MAMQRPVDRLLRGYALDPGFSTQLDTVGINEVLYRIPFEPVEPGPVGEYLEVLDFDPASGCWYEPVDLGDEAIASQQGLAPSEGNPQFHQQFVYTVAMKTIRHFERALGRRIIWHQPWLPNQRQQAHVGRLRIYPHALRDANAYYDRDRLALLFGYFSASDRFLGGSIPGGLVFTCLSPDIVAHETTHALLDSIHHRYLEGTNPDVAAFHEGFADIVALLQRFTFRDLVEHQLAASDGRLDRYTVFGELATQFGEALGESRGGLRSMIGRWNEEGRWVPLEPTPGDYANATEEHDRGAVLVATVFDAFRRVYAHRTADLFRIAGRGHPDTPSSRLDIDLVRRLAAEAAEIAEHLLHICIRALDYCPPVDITFGDFLRALITADLDIAPHDENGYRVALIEAFRARGIIPTNVNTMSVESLKWVAPPIASKHRRALDSLVASIRSVISTLVQATDRAELHEASRVAGARIHKHLSTRQAMFAEADWEAFLNQLGLTARPVSRLFPRTKSVRFVDPKTGRRSSRYVPRLEVHTVRPAFRGGREERQIEQVLITLTQTIRAEVGDPDAPRVMTFRGGCSLIFRLGQRNELEYVVRKSISNYGRFRAQADFLAGDPAFGPTVARTYASGEERDWRIDFNLLHRR